MTLRTYLFISILELQIFDFKVGKYLRFKLSYQVSYASFQGNLFLSPPYLKKKPSESTPPLLTSGGFNMFSSLT